MNGPTATRQDPLIRTLRRTRLALFVLFLAPLVFGCLSAYQAWQSRSFVGVDGRIVETHVDTVHERRHSRQSHTPRSSSKFLHVTYVYSVDGREYEGTRIEAGTFGLASGDSVRRYADKLKEDAAVTVYVDPKNPEVAVLERGFSSVAKFLFFMCGFLGVILMFLSLLIRGAQKPSKFP